MIIKTRKLPATQGAPERMRATAVDQTATLTVAFPYAAKDPGYSVAYALGRAFGYPDVEKRVPGSNVWHTVGDPT